MRRARIRIAALLVVALLANGLVVVPAAPAAGGSSVWERLSEVVTRLVGPDRAEAAQAAPAPQRVEVPRLRTRNSRTYRTPEGLLEAVVSAGPVNYQDTSGAWQPIDNTLVATSTPGYAWQNKADRYRVLLPPNLKAPVRIQRGEAWLTFKVVGAAAAQGTVSGNTVTYRDVFPGVTISFGAVGDELKESIVLANASAPASYSFEVQTSPGLEVKPNSSGGLDVYQGSTFQFALPAPFMTDASNTVAGFSPAVAFRTTPTPTGISLTVAADPAWLQSPERQWPVTIDPTVVLTGPSVNADCHIVGGNYANQGFCASTELEVGSYSTGTRRGLLYFPVEPALPRDSQVLAAKLSLYVPRPATNGPLTVGLRRLTNPFTLDATWIKRNATTNWTTPGGDYDPATIDTVSAGAAAGWVELSAPTVVQGWVNGEEDNDGFLLRRQVEDSNDFVVRFISRNSTDSAHWPTLTIAYDARLGKRDAYSYDTKGLSDRSEASVNLANGNLVAGATDFNLRGIGPDLAVNRTYNGLADPNVVGSVGRGWNLSVGFDVHLTTFPSGPVALHGATREALPFLPKPSPPDSWSGPPGTNASMTRSLSGSTYTYTLTWHKTGEVWTFTRPTSELVAKLTRQRDRNDNRLNITYDTSGRLAKVEQLRRGQTAGTGRTVTASYVGASTLIDKLTDSTGRVVDYGYTGNDLTSVTDADNKIVQYAYTGDTLTRITDARNNIINIGYETGGTRRVASITRVTAATGDTDPKTSYSYTAFSSQTCNGRTTQFATTNLTDANNKTTTYKYDARDRVCRTTDPLGHTHDGEYDTADNVLSATDALAKITSFRYSTPDANGVTNLETITGAGGAVTTFAYGDANNPYSPKTRTDSSGNETTYTYAAPGNLMSAQDTTTGGTGATSSVTRNLDGTVATARDPNNRTTSYAYTYTSGLLTRMTVTPPSGSVLGTTTVNYDNLQRVSSITDGKSQTRSFTYDAIDRLTSETVISLTVSRTHDANGNLTQLTDPTGATTFTYDELNRGRTKDLPGRAPITYTYDGVGNLKTLDDAGGTVSYRYDAANRVDQLTEPGSNLTSFGYDNADRRTSVNLPNQVAITLGYDDAGRQTSVKAVKGATTLVNLKYCYNKVAITDTTACSPSQTNATDIRYKLTDSRTGTTTNYAYDTLSRLKQAKTTVGGTDDFQYLYDLAGNRTKQVINGTSTFYGYGTGNELCWSKVTATSPGSACTAPTGATTYSHDSNGNLTGSSAGFGASYNGFDQTTSITAPGGATLSPMTYGGSTQDERRRAGGTDFTTSALGLQEADPSGQATFYTRDPSGNLISQRTPSGTHYYILDALGSVVALTDSAGAVVGRYSYQPYGKATHSGTVTSAFQFASGYHDSQTGLLKFGTRYYDSNLGRWTQRDPEGDASYTYAENCPNNRVDPTGRYALTVPTNCAPGQHAFALVEIATPGSVGASAVFVDAAGTAVTGYFPGAWQYPGPAVISAVPLSSTTRITSITVYGLSGVLPLFWIYRYGCFSVG
jgi:RHS repeat-associated protein